MFSAAEDAVVVVAAHDFRFIDRRQGLGIFGGRRRRTSFAAAFDEDVPL